MLGLEAECHSNKCVVPDALETSSFIYTIDMLFFPWWKLSIICFLVQIHVPRNIHHWKTKENYSAQLELKHRKFNEASIAFTPFYRRASGSRSKWAGSYRMRVTQLNTLQSARKSVRASPAKHSSWNLITTLTRSHAISDSPSANSWHFSSFTWGQTTHLISKNIGLPLTHCQSFSRWRSQAFCLVLRIHQKFKLTHPKFIRESTHCARKHAGTSPVFRIKCFPFLQKIESTFWQSCPKSENKNSSTAETSFKWSKLCKQAILLQMKYTPLKVTFNFLWQQLCWKEHSCHRISTITISR